MCSLTGPLYATQSFQCVAGDQLRYDASPDGKHPPPRGGGGGGQSRPDGLNAQARILVDGKVTHLGYYKEEEEAARAYDRVSLAQCATAATNFPAGSYRQEDIRHLASLDRAGLQTALGVKPMHKSSR